MAEEDKTPNAIKDLLWIILILIFLAILWYASGGSSSPLATSGPFLDMPQERHLERARKQTEEITFKNTAKENGEEGSKEKEEIMSDESIYKGKVFLKIPSAARKDNPQSEYIEITTSSKNDGPVPISNWKVEGKRGLDIKIGKGVYLMFQNEVNIEEPIFLYPGEKAIVITGRSPNGKSFKLNTCTGYFEQFQNFIPKLPKQCPYPEDEELPNYLKNDDDCFDYIERLPRCEIIINPPDNISGECKNYIREKLNYKTCLDIHKNDSDFYKPEWRIYLNREEEMWKQKRETITLWDENNKIIDQKSY